MKSIKFKNCLAGLLAASIGLAAGCEEEDDSPNPPAGNGGSVKEHFYVSTQMDHVGAGATSDEVADVLPNRNYTTLFTVTNDGAKDLLEFTIDGRKVGTYRTEPHRNGGHGWYEDQYAGPFVFTSTGNTVRLRVKVLSSGDEWGVWPQGWNVSLVP